METIDLQDPMEPLKREPNEVRSIIQRVLKLEAERLYQERPHINDDILRIIKEVVNDSP
ncbi:hypothetical protein [Chromobacterium haemolyticum]|uniref:hypothetical protein n=1 Tax=Chromobacterium haemolyticum TaxID=394935 RepID=UPI0013BEA1D1|nr:hypothetical protein [Chromobacterium haemolyticum]